MKPTCNWFPAESTGPLKEAPAVPAKAPRSCSGFLSDLRAREAQAAGLCAEGQEAPASKVEAAGLPG